MKVKTLTYTKRLCALISAFLTRGWGVGLNAQVSYAQVPLTAGSFNYDCVAETSPAFITAASMDDSGYTLYAQSYPGNPGGGMPNNLSIVSGPRTYGLRPYNGPNALYLTSGNPGTMTFSSPDPASNLYILWASTLGNSIVSATVTFTDATTQALFTHATVPDWLYNTPFVVSGLGRIGSVTGMFDGYPANPRLYELSGAILPQNQSKRIASVTFTQANPGSRTYIFGIARSFTSCAPPTARCQPATVQLGNNGTANLGTALDNGSSSACGNPVSLSANPDLFGCAQLGAHTSTLTVTDLASGGTATCSATVTVQDISPPSAICAVAQSPNAIVNGSFENGFSGWTTYSLSSPFCAPWTVAPSSSCWNHGAAATDGALLAYNGFDGCGPDAFTLYQDVTVPPNGVLTWDDYIELVLTFGASMGRSFSVEILNPSNNNLLATVYSQTYAPNTSNWTGLENHSVSLAAFGGQTVRILFRMTITECYTGPGMFAIDNVALTATANLNVNLDNAGNATIAAYLVNAGSTDNCGVASATVSPSAFNCTHVGSNTVTLTVTDASGNTATCASTIQVQDVTPPAALCRTATVQLDNSGSATVTATQVNNQSTDACGVGSLNVAPGTFSCANIGSNTVTLTVTDQNNNVSTCSATVVVQDLPPVITCPANITSGNSQNQCGAYISYWVDAADNCDAQLNNAPIPGYTFLGTEAGHAYYLSNGTATWASARTAAVSLNADLVSINSGTENNFLLNAMSAAGAGTAWIGFNDRSSEGAFEWSDGSPVGYTNWGRGEPDNAGDEDAVQLQNNGRWNDVSEFTSQPYIIERPSVAVLSQVSGVASGGFFPAGTTTNVWRATDAHGNTATCSFLVAVNEVEPPVALCAGIVNNGIVNGSFENGFTGWNTGSLSSPFCAPWTVATSSSCWTQTATPTHGSKLAYNGFDGCGPDEFTLWQDVLVHPGMNLAWDDYIELQLTFGATVGRSFTVEIRNPVSQALMGTVHTQNFAPNTNTWTGLQHHSVSLAAFAGQTVRIVFRLEVPECYTGPGMYVLDNVSLSGGGAVNANLGSNGQFAVTRALIDAGSTDNCGIQGYSFQPSVLTCSNLGRANVMMTVTDNAGNTSTCMSVVNLHDVTAPVAQCRNATVNLSSAGPVSISPATVNGGTTDNCTVFTLTVNPGMFSCANTTSPVPVTLTAGDQSGNTSTCTALLTVHDVTPPAAVCQNLTINVPSSGSTTVTPGQIGSGCTDNCAVGGMTLNPDSFQARDRGINPVTLTVTDSAGNLSTCSATVTVTTDPLVASAGSATRTCGYNISCNGAADGTIRANATGGSLPYSYQWSGPGGYSSFNANISGLIAGTYSVTVTDANGDQDTTSITLTEPAPVGGSLVISTSTCGYNVGCYGAANGSVTVQGTGGCAPHTYDWSNGQTGASSNGWPAGNHSVTITDANNCSNTVPFVITQPDPLEVTACNDQTVAMGYDAYEYAMLTVVNTSGGCAPYTYSWSNGAGSGPSVIVRPAFTTTYTVTVTDANGCSATDDITVTVVDVRCQGSGSKMDHVMMCGGTGNRGPRTKCVKMKDVYKKMQQGYTLGPCGGNFNFDGGDCGDADYLSCNCNGKIRRACFTYNGASGATVVISADGSGNRVLGTFTNVQTGQELCVDGTSLTSGALASRTYIRVNGGAAVKFYTNCSKAGHGDVQGQFTLSSWTDESGAICNEAAPPVCECSGRITRLMLTYAGPPGATVKVFGNSAHTNRLGTFTGLNMFDPLQLNCNAGLPAKVYLEIAGSGQPDVVISVKCGKLFVGDRYYYFDVAAWKDQSGTSCPAGVLKGEIQNESEGGTDETTFGAYPNPFHESTTVEFYTGKTQDVELKVYSLQGTEVATLFQGEAESGLKYKISFCPETVGSGVYFARLVTGSGEVMVEKLVLQR